MRGTFYATAVETDRSGRRIARQVARQASTFAAARAALDATGLPGYVQVWSDRTQSRAISATRRADGSWFAVDPHTGAEREVS